MPVRELFSCRAGLSLDLRPKAVASGRRGVYSNVVDDSQEDVPAFARNFDGEKGWYFPRQIEQIYVPSIINDLVLNHLLINT